MSGKIEKCIRDWVIQYVAVQFSWAYTEIVIVIDNAIYITFTLFTLKEKA